jgi:hypothetical protein
MRKIKRQIAVLCIALMVFAGLASAADTTATWISTSSTDMNNVANYSFDPAAQVGITADTKLRFIDTTGTEANATATGNFTCGSFITSGFPANISLSGRTTTIGKSGGKMSISQLGTINYGANVLFTATPCTLYIDSSGAAAANAQFKVNAANVNLRVKIDTTCMGSGYVLFGNNSTTSPCTVTQFGNINNGNNLELDINMGAGAGVNNVYDANGYNIACGDFYPGNSAAGNSKVVLGSGTHNIKTYNNFYNSGTCSLYLNTSSITCRGNWTFAANHAVNPGTSVVTFTAGGTITSAGNHYYYDVIHNSSGTLTIGDSLLCNGDFTNTAGNYTQASKISRVAGDFLQNGTGTLNLGNGVFMTGNNGQFHVGSTSGTVTATACSLRYSGTGQTDDDDLGITIKCFNVAASASVTSGGAAATRTFADGAGSIPLTVGANGSFTNNNAITVLTSTVGTKYWNIDATATMAGTGQYRLQCGANSITDTVPAITYTGTGALNIGGTSSVTGWTNLLTGNVSWGTGTVSLTTGTGSTGTFNGNGFGISNLGTIRTSPSASTNLTTSMGSGAYTCSTFQYALTGTDSINWNSSVWTIKKDTLRIRSGAVSTPSTARINFTNPTLRARIIANATSVPVCSLRRGAYVDSGATFAELLFNRAGLCTLTAQKAKKITITTLDSLDWSGPDTSNRNRWHSSTDDTVRTSRDTLDIPGTRGFANMRWRNTYSPDTIRCRTGCKSEGGNY